MSITFTKESDDLFVIRVDGVFTGEDKKEIENKGRQELKLLTCVRMLVLAAKFAGWGREGDWGDLTFLYESDPKIEKIAVVAEGKWKDEMLMYLGAGRRQAQVKFFLYDEEEVAKVWLQSEND